MENKRKTTGILNKGKDNRFIGNTFSGLDVGIQDEGEKTLAAGNRFSNGGNDLRQKKQEEMPRVEKKDEVLKLKPEVHGIGIDLKALWRKFWNR